MAPLHSAINNTVSTIKNCEEEPIHIPGSVQPHGFLLVIDAATGIIELCSENTARFLTDPPAYFLAKKYDEVLPAQMAAFIKARFAASDQHQHIPAPVLVGDKPFDCFAKASGNFICIECIPADENPYNVYDLFSHTNDLLKQTDDFTDLQKLCSLVAGKIRNITGYDRAMIYRFDEHYNGHVFAESIAEGTESFFDLYYPNTDIPKQARDLYLKNLMRLIPDVSYTPVPIVTLKPALADPEKVNLSNVYLRSVSPIHIRYLKNMEVGATLTISLIKDGRLWGLVACHHREPKIVPYSKQMQAYLLSQLLSSQIGVQETAEKYALAQKLEVPQKILMQFLARDENFIELHFEKENEIIETVNATGAALVYKNKVYHNGATPPAVFILSLEKWLRNKAVTSYVTDNLSADFKEAEVFQNLASGILFFQLNVGEQPSIIWFRPAAEKVITWAGNPNAQKELSPLTPRSSFAAWKEMKKGYSEKWQHAEKDSAFHFAYILQRHIFHLHQREEELRYRKLNEQLLKANKELENINWISTHDLKEPLRKIQIFASMMDSQQQTDVNSMRQSIERIRNAAARMQTFIDDLLLYSKMSNSDQAYEPVDMNEVVQAALIEFSEEKEQEIFELRIAALPILRASRFQMHQLFINLIGNAIKFRKDGEKQVINVTAEDISDNRITSDEKSAWHTIIIKDSGVGFDMEMADSIFDIFKRAHSDEKFKGTGVGLSICRKIMENHGGRITAKSNENEGAEFILYFPKTNPV